MQQCLATAPPQLDLRLEVVRIRLHARVQTSGLQGNHLNGEPGKKIQL